MSPPVLLHYSFEHTAGRSLIPPRPLLLLITSRFTVPLFPLPNHPGLRKSLRMEPLGVFCGGFDELGRLLETTPWGRAGRGLSGGGGGYWRFLGGQTGGRGAREVGGDTLVTATAEKVFPRLQPTATSVIAVHKMIVALQNGSHMLKFQFQLAGGESLGADL